MNILEALERPFLSSKKIPVDNLSSFPREDDVIQNLDDIIPTGFFDTIDNIYMNNEVKKQKRVKEQNELINNYRRIAMQPEVAGAISIITDEATFSPGSTEIIEMDFGSDLPLSIKDILIEELKYLTSKMNLNKNIYSLFYGYYVDGQLNVHISYDNKHLQQGIQQLTVISPLNLQFNNTIDKWEYTEHGYSSTFIRNDREANRIMFDKEEVIRVDSGIYSDGLILGNLHTAIKPANMLQTLEDMLIPMRFMRSVSRRVFNVDVSKLNNKKAEEVMNKNQAKFKYKKFYNLETGTISNQQHIASLTEDYWFPNRSGEKGTTVEMLDETGNLGQLDDIIYFKKKLYTSLNVPTARINDGEGTSEFDFAATAINREELKFFNFISRLRNQFLELFYGLLRRQIVSKGISTELEWEEIHKLFSIKFKSENKFFEKMEMDKLTSALTAYLDVEPLVGKYFSRTFVFKKLFGFSDDEIIVMMDEIEKEKKNKKFSNLTAEPEPEE